jgi:hypothetical protein
VKKHNKKRKPTYLPLFLRFLGIVRFYF